MVVGIFVSKGKTIKRISGVASENIYALDLSEDGAKADDVSVLSEDGGAILEESEVSDTSNWDLTKVDIVYDTEGIAVPVPKGYVASGADGEHTVNTGFVIYEGDGEVTTENAWDESCTRNQWVWVPVPDVSRIYEIDSNGKKKSKLYTYTETGRSIYKNNSYEPGILTGYDNEKYFSRCKIQGMTRDKLLYDLQKEFNFMIESIEKYGGFYIGRYETGNLKSLEPVVQRMQDTRSVDNTWYAEYTRMQFMGASANVKTSMIFGCLWDETLQWLIDTGNKTYADMKDSTSWGNYNNATFEYMTTNGTMTTKSKNSNGLAVRTGSTEYTNANNIYDLAGGGKAEFILEGNGYNRRSVRSGNYGDTGSNGPASVRRNVDPDLSSGARAYLYIK